MAARALRCRTAPLAAAGGRPRLLTGLALTGAGARTTGGFVRHELGREWYATKEELLRAEPGPVLVSSSYELPQSSTKPARQVKKYSSFQSHDEYWESVERFRSDDILHNMHEVFEASEARSLYFDLDGHPCYRAWHSDITKWLTRYVRWAFSGDRLGWGADDPEPMVMLSSDMTKYSCHVVFPQIQFESHAVQSEYMRILLSGLSALKVEMEGETIAILEEVVDRAVYTSFQLFRGPYACKLAKGRLRRETQLEPEEGCFFRNDPLACFAGHVDKGHSLTMPSPAEMLEWNEELRHEQDLRTASLLAVEDGRPWQVSPQDLANLYIPQFQMQGGGSIDLAGLPPLELYERALPHLHPARSSQWWSWFRISGVTYTLLEQYKNNPEATERIWRAHCAWSSGYQSFDEQENYQKVFSSKGRRVSGVGLLVKMMKYDNPGKTVRDRL